MTLDKTLRQWLQQGYTANETPLDGYGAEVVREVLAALSSAPPDLVALRLVLKCAERACNDDNTDTALDYVREAIRHVDKLSPAPPVAETPECAGPFVSAFDCPKCDPRRVPASPVVAPAPVVEHEDPAIAAKTRAVMAEIAANHFTTVNQCPGLLAFGPIYRALAALSPRETAPGGGR